MLFQLFPTLDQHFSDPVTTLLKRWSVEFFSRLPDATVEQMSRRFLEGLPPSAILCVSPVLSKLGQVLSRDSRLSPEIRKELMALESSEPRGFYRPLRREVARVCSGRYRLGQAIAEGSLAVVFPVRSGNAEGVAKILKTGIEEQLHLELRALEKSVEFLQSEAQKAKLPHFDYSSVVQRVRHYLEAEVDLLAERRNLALAATKTNSERLAIPKVWSIGNRNVLVMDRLFGKPLQPESVRPAIKELLIKPIFNSDEVGLLHGDLHGGNLMTCDDGRVGVLDWGLCLKLNRAQRSQVSRLTTALMLGRSAAAGQALQEMGIMPRTLSLRGGLGERLDGLLEGSSGVLPEWLVILRKTFHQLEGVLSSTNSEVSLEQVILSEGIQQLVLEWPFRWFISPTSRDVFGSNLSTVDLWSLVLPTS